MQLMIWMVSASAKGASSNRTASRTATLPDFLIEFKQFLQNKNLQQGIYLNTTQLTLQEVLGSFHKQNSKNNYREKHQNTSIYSKQAIINHINVILEIFFIYILNIIFLRANFKLIFPTLRFLFLFYRLLRYQSIKWVMNKQRLLRFRIRKCRRVRGMVATDFHDKLPDERSHCRPRDEKTEIRQVANEWIDEEHQFDLQKQGQLPQVNHFSQRQLENEIEREEATQYISELPTLSIQRNPEIQEDHKQKNSQQDKHQLQGNNAEITINTKKIDFEEKKAPTKAQQTEIQMASAYPSQQVQPISQQSHQIKLFSSILKSPTISLNKSSTTATQSEYYWQNNKLILSKPVKNQSRAVFKVINLKYCVGMGVAIKEIIQKHEYNYKSYENELSHGLFLVTSQGYSWSHAYKAEDDCFRADFKKIKNNDTIEVAFENGSVGFTYKQASFSLSIPDSVLQKYTICFCAYLHEKSDSIGFELDELGGESES